MEMVIVGVLMYIMSSEKVHMLESGSIPNDLKHLGNTVEKLGYNWYRIYFRKETGSEGIIPGKRVNGASIPVDVPKFPGTNPPDGSLLSNPLWGETDEKPSEETKGYEDLTRILDEALQQATSGKGKERHAGNKPFDKQPIMEIARMTGLAYQTGQAMKKIQESHTLLEIKGKEAAINELRGAIIYLAAAIKTIEEN